MRTAARLVTVMTRQHARGYAGQQRRDCATRQLARLHGHGDDAARASVRMLDTDQASNAETAQRSSWWPAARSMQRGLS